nr:hypothetical protein Iba_chr14fCG10820 [Ipomoea batatas]
MSVPCRPLSAPELPVVGWILGAIQCCGRIIAVPAAANSTWLKHWLISTACFGLDAPIEMTIATSCPLAFRSPVDFDENYGLRSGCGPSSLGSRLLCACHLIHVSLEVPVSCYDSSSGLAVMQPPL